MRIEARFPSAVNVRLSVRYYDPELDDIRSVLSDVCHAVESQGKFAISGFGQECWPVDFGTDLVVLLEQLPSLINAIYSRSSATLDLYEQGIERTLTFKPVADRYEVTCASRSEWQPNPKTESVSVEELERMLLKIRHEFLRLVRDIAPDLAEHPWLHEWADRHRN